MVKLVVLVDPQIKLMYDLVMCDLPETSDMLQLMIIHMMIAAKSYKFKRNIFYLLCIKWENCIKK